jgi:hypothetical protein
MFYEATFSIKAAVKLLIQLATVGAVLAAMAYGCALVAGWEWLNPFRAFGIIGGVFVLMLLARVVRWAFGVDLFT